MPEKDGRETLNYNWGVFVTVGDTPNWAYSSD